MPITINKTEFITFREKTSSEQLRTLESEAERCSEYDGEFSQFLSDGGLLESLSTQQGPAELARWLLDNWLIPSSVGRPPVTMPPVDQFQHAVRRLCVLFPAVLEQVYLIQYTNLADNPKVWNREDHQAIWESPEMFSVCCTILGQLKDSNDYLLDDVLLNSPTANRFLHYLLMCIKENLSSREWQITNGIRSSNKILLGMMLEVDRYGKIVAASGRQAFIHELVLAYAMHRPFDEIRSM